MKTITQRIDAAIAALKAHDLHHHDFDDFDGYPDSELQTQHLAAVADLESLIELKLDAGARMRETLVDVVDNHSIAMGAALIDAELDNPLAGMSWIFNTLCGPGLLPDVDEARRPPRLSRCSSRAFRASRRGLDAPPNPPVSGCPRPPAS